MSKTPTKQEKRARRHGRVRSRIKGTAECPRLAVFRSNHFVYAQLINDDSGVTLAAADSRTAKGKGARERAQEVGADIAAKAAKAGITKTVFDRGGFLYAGTIKELADSARKAGLVF